MTTLTLLAICAIGNSAADELPRSLYSASVVQEGEVGHGVRGTLGITGRATWISGTAVDNFPFDEVDYNEMFGTGFGFRAEAGLLFHIGKAWYLGPVLSIGYDHYSGEEATDASGDTVEPDGMSAVPVLVGARFRYAPPSGFVLEMRVSFGAMSWSEVNGTTVVSGTPNTNASIFESATRFCFEMGFKVGFRAGPASFTFGTGFWVAGGPGKGTNLNATFDPGSVVAGFVELGVDFQC